jgi:anaerobic selenocysteine-containing dehydrogenase
MYAGTKPAAIHQGPSLDHCVNGTQTFRAISILVAITGNFDVPGGNSYVLPLNLEGFRIPLFLPKEEPVGKEYPLFGTLPSQIARWVPETTAIPLIDTMVTGKPYPIKGLIVQGSNPILTWPNVNKVRKGIEGLELMVAIDIFMTETAKLADIVLPAAAFLEKAWLVDYVFNSLPMVGFTDRVIDPPGRSLPDWKIWSELGKKMGYQDLFPWENDEEVFRDLLAPTNITLGCTPHITSRTRENDG